MGPGDVPGAGDCIRKRYRAQSIAKHAVDFILRKVFFSFAVAVCCLRGHLLEPLFFSSLSLCIYLPYESLTWKSMFFGTTMFLYLHVLQFHCHSESEGLRIAQLVRRSDLRRSSGRSTEMGG